MSNWVSTKIDVGIVDEMDTVRIKFEGNPDMKTVKKVVAGCAHCTKVNFDKQSKVLHAELTLGQTPRHLRQNRLNAFDKRIAVQYEDGTVENIFIIGKKRTID